MLTFPAVRLASPPNEKRTVMPRRRRNSELRTREHLTASEAALRSSSRPPRGTATVIATLP